MSVRWTAITPTNEECDYRSSDAIKSSDLAIALGQIRLSAAKRDAQGRSLKR